MTMTEAPNLAAPPHDTDALRAGTWALLGRLLTEAPSDEIRRRLRSIETGGHVGDALGHAWAALRDAALDARDDALQTEFQDVFIGVGGGEVTPYASWYLTGSLLDRPLVRLREDLDALGIVRSEGCSEPEDHAAAVCEMMALALLDEDIDPGWQKELFLRHIDGWMVRFFEDLERAPGAEFYRAVGALGKAFVELEKRIYAMPA